MFFADVSEGGSRHSGFSISIQAPEPSIIISSPTALTKILASGGFSTSIEAFEPSNSCSWQTSLNVAPDRQLQHIDPGFHAFEFVFLADVLERGSRPSAFWQKFAANTNSKA